MSRRQAREVALQALFQLDFNEIQQDTAVDAALGEAAVMSDKDRAYARSIVTGVQTYRVEIDAVITKSSREWKVERMSGVDRNITRIAVFEMRFGEEKIDSKIIINEAVELAKKFGTDDSGRFVNGILGAMLK